MGFFEEITLMPTAIFTTLMCVVAGYWVFVLIGALDLDFLGGADAGDGIDLDVDAGGGGGDVDLDAGGGGDADVDLDADAGSAAGGSSSFDLLGALKLRTVPLTVSISFLVMWAWLLCYFGMHLLGPIDAIPGWLTGTGVSALAVVGSLFLSSLTVRPFGPIFRTHAAPSKSGLLGEVVTITTGSVTKEFGQARHDDGEAGSLLSVRCDNEDIKLGRGDKAFIVDYDEKRDVFLVEPAGHLLPEEIDGSTAL